MRCERALAWLVAQTRDLPIFFTVGLPWAQGENVYNVVAACCRGRLLGLTVKKHLPNHSEFYEAALVCPRAVKRPLFSGSCGHCRWTLRAVWVRHCVSLRG